MCIHAGKFTGSRLNVVAHEVVRSKSARPSSPIMSIGIKSHFARAKRTWLLANAYFASIAAGHARRSMPGIRHRVLFPPSSLNSCSPNHRSLILRDQPAPCSGMKRSCCWYSLNRARLVTSNTNAPCCECGRGCCDSLPWRSRLRRWQGPASCLVQRSSMSSAPFLQIMTLHKLQCKFPLLDRIADRIPSCPNPTADRCRNGDGDCMLRTPAHGRPSRCSANFS